MTFVLKLGAGSVLIDNVLIRDLICPNVAPVFNHDSVVKPAAIEDRSYAATLSADVFDPNEGDTLTFSLFSASPWVTLDPNGVIAGMPDDAHVGANLLTVRVQDDLGGFDEAVLEIEVLDLYKGKNGFYDFAAFSQSWLLTNCGYCGGGDLNESDNVDFLDFALFPQNWLN